MPFISCTADGSDHLANLRRLVAARWAALAVMTGLTLLLPGPLEIPLPLAPLLVLLGIAALFNATVQWRVRNADSASPAELFTQLLIDIATLGALVFFSGGATNPLVSLLLPPVAIAALTLPVRCVVAIGVAAIPNFHLFHPTRAPTSWDSSPTVRLLHTQAPTRCLLGIDNPKPQEALRIEHFPAPSNAPPPPRPSPAAA